MATSAVSSTTSTSGTTATTSTAAQLAAANKASAQKIISSLSAGSGVDVASLAQNLVDAEKAPQANAINAKIAKNDAKVSGMSAVMFMMSELKNALTAVKDKDSFNSLSITNSNTGAVGVVAAGSALAGQHSVSVSSLTQAQRSISSGFATSSTAINGGNSFALTLAGTNAGVSVGTASTSTSSNVATIFAPQFGSTPSVSDFKNFSITLDGAVLNLAPSPTTATLADLAADIQKQLRAYEGTEDLSVSVDSGTNLTITSATSTRVLTAPSLSASTVINLDSGASVGTSDGATITGAAFGTVPSLNDFSSFTVNIGGTVRTLIPASASPNMSSLAQSLQFQLRALDGTDDVSVSYSGSVLTVSSASGKAITGIGITKQTYADTPAGVVDAINNSGRGYKAQLINDGSSAPFKVMITGANGATEGFSISSTDTAGNAFGTGLTVPSGYGAADASVVVDGISYTRKSNLITDIIPGVTLSLKGVTTSAASISMDRDTTDLKTRLNALVVAYNDFNDIVNQTTDPKSTLETYGNTLVGDSTVRMIRQQMRSLLFSPSSTPGRSVSALSQLGYSLNEKGVLSLDAAKLDTVIQNNFEDVTKLFTGGYNNLSTYSSLRAGIAGDAVKKLTDMLSSTGQLATKTNNANTENDKYRVRLVALQTRMDALLARYQKQFASMESLVGSVNSQKTSLKSTFDGMMAMYTNK
jgi:flagellar hook-associated protein 2